MINPDDWYLDLIDRKFLFLQAGAATFATIFHDAPPGKADHLIIGYATSKDTFQMPP